MAARKICDLAEKELWMVNKAGTLLPGDFNMAASTLYGGYYGVLNNASASWFDEKSIGMTVAEAQRVFMTAVAWVATKTQCDGIISAQNMEETKTFKSIQTIKSEVRALEVVKITMPDDAMVAAFGGTKDVYGETGKIKPLGFLTVREWQNPEAADEDLTEDEEEQQQNPRHEDEFLWVEGSVLESCFVGMKFVATVRELNVGIKYFDSVNHIFCSFFTLLPNELMDGWKEPVANPRPAPSADDPDNGDEDELE